MSTLKVRDVKKQVAGLNLKLYLKSLAQKEGNSLRNLSFLMGMHKDFMYRKSDKGDLTGTEMVIISNYMDVNVPELYMNLLHETCRPTKAEKQLKLKVAELEKELEEVKRERDWLKGVVEKK